MPLCQGMGLCASVPFSFSVVYGETRHLAPPLLLMSQNPQLSMLLCFGKTEATDFWYCTGYE